MMGRPKGSKNKLKTDVPPEAMEKGNPAFNINALPEELKPKSDGVAMAALTEEDMDFERRLQNMHQDEIMEQVSDPMPPDAIVTKEKIVKEHLADEMDDYRPAQTIRELEDQVFMAKQSGCDSIDATEAIVRYYCRRGFEDVKRAGYFIFKDVKVYISGLFKEASKRDRMSIHDKIFGGTKSGDIVPIATSQVAQGVK